MNKPKQKGTSGEREVKRAAEEHGFTVDRMPPSSTFDLRVRGREGARVINALATRPDAGHWLVSITLHEFLDLLDHRGCEAHIEVKRYRRFSHHTIFDSKFGRS